jgi:hypothetical protein
VVVEPFFFVTTAKKALKTLCGLPWTQTPLPLKRGQLPIYILDVDPKPVEGSIYSNNYREGLATVVTR